VALSHRASGCVDFRFLFPPRNFRHFNHLPNHKVLDKHTDPCYPVPDQSCVRFSPARRFVLDLLSSFFVTPLE
jgi:hypothetical protein